MITHIMYYGEMATKTQRQDAIREMVQNGRLTDQGELLAGLRKLRIRVDQSTLSRDLAELGVKKRRGYYVLEVITGHRQTLDLSGAVHSFTVCGPHMVVVRTGVGQAQPVAVEIDAAEEPAVAGTISGDDTVFVATKSRRMQTVLLRRLQTWFGDKYER